MPLQTHHILASTEDNPPNFIFHFELNFACVVVGCADCVKRVDDLHGTKPALTSLRFGNFY